jgi:hypothetical protein
MKKIAMCAAFGLFAALAAGPAQAGTTHTTGGEACQSVYDTSYTYGKYIFYGNGVHAFDKVDAKFFSCPMARVNGLSATGLSSAYVDVYDASNGSMWCSLTATDEFGNQLPGGSGAKYSGGGGQREISFGNIASSDPWGTYNMFCTMMPTVTAYNSYIYSYQWVER